MKKPSELMAFIPLCGKPDILMEQPGQAIPTEGSHEYSVDVMNTSFLLVRDKDTAK
jgi:hypothetical protein